MDSEIEDKVYNIERVLEDIKQLPQTYNTILQTEVCLNATLLTILRRKLSTLCKSGRLFKTTIPGTRFGKILFYHPQKEHKIYIISERSGSDVYVAKEHTIIDNTWITFDECWILKKSRWEQKYNVTIYETRILLIL